ncbi:DUF1145 domain-containing protein [Pseudomonas sp. M30-35]|uniref:DUF1145 domain-containing protein n=1 Tax=Pseudomonas sp. M30-35 TaxID=1981174 RepID=UPI0012FDF5BE|nr:DUF1145 domain-containing protein [Pseudomonas sp. M30-35]
MKVILSVGAVLTLLFWGVVVGNLVAPFAQPFSMLLNIAGALVAAAHIVELWYFQSALQQSSTPWLCRAKILVLGVFHAFTLKHDHNLRAAPVAVSVEQGQSQAVRITEPEGDSHLQLHMQFEPVTETNHA